MPITGPVVLNGQMYGAYKEPFYRLNDGRIVTLYELIEYLLENGGGGSGINDITEGTGEPSGAPATGAPSVYQDINTGNLYTWNGTAWTLVTGGGSGGDDDIIEGAGAPSTAPGAGQPQVYQNTTTGNLYVWNGSTWIQATGVDVYATALALVGTQLRLTQTNSTVLTAELGGLVGGGGILQYEAAGTNGTVDDGCFVTATGQFIEYERTGGAGQNTEGVLLVPPNVIMRGLSIHFNASQAPGNTFYLNVDYSETNRDVNGALSTLMPVMGTVTSKPSPISDGSPYLNFVHSGTPLQIGIVQVDDNGTRTRIRYKISNYNQQVGAGASILTLIFP